MTWDFMGINRKIWEFVAELQADAWQAFKILQTQPKAYTINGHRSSGTYHILTDRPLSVKSHAVPFLMTTQHKAAVDRA